MRNTLKAQLLAIGILSITVSVAGSVAHAADKPAKAAGGQFSPAAELKWNDVPGMTGIQVAAVDGPEPFLSQVCGRLCGPAPPPYVEPFRNRGRGNPGHHRRRGRTQAAGRILLLFHEQDQTSNPV